MRMECKCPASPHSCDIALGPLHLQHMSVPQLIDTILINPTVFISPSYRDTGQL